MIKKKRLFSNKSKKAMLIATTLSLSIAPTCVMLFNSNYSNESSLNSNNLSSSINSSSATTYSTNTDVKDIPSDFRAPDNTAYNDVITEDGFFVYEKDTGKINYFSFFGNFVWSYDLTQSKFISLNIGQVNATQITYVAMKYNFSIGRIVVYGIANNVSFMFQLNKDGSEYFVNSGQTDDTRYANSFLSSNNNNGLVANILNLSVFSDKSAISIPDTDVDLNNKTLNTYKINLDTCRFNAITIDFTNYTYAWDTANGGNTVEGTTYVPKKILSIEMYGSGKYLMFFQSINKDNATNPESTVYLSHIILNEKFVYNPPTVASQYNKNLIPIVKFKDANTLSTQFNPKNINIKTIKRNNGTTLSVMAYNITPLEMEYIGTSTDSSIIAFISSLSEDRFPAARWENSYYENAWMSGVVMDNILYASNIAVNPYTSEVIVYFWGKINWDKSQPYKNEYASYYTTLINTYGYPEGTNAGFDHVHFDTLKRTPLDSNTTNIFIAGNNLTLADNYYYLTFIPIFDKNYSMNNTSFIACFYAWNKTTKQPLDLTTNIYKYPIRDGVGTLSKFDLQAVPDQQTSFNNYSDATLKSKLPQDVTVDDLDKFIYLKNLDGSGDRQYESKLLLDASNPLSYDNATGSLSGTVNMQLKKWWRSNTATITQKLEIKVSGFATTQELAFQLVINQGVDATKWAEIEKLKSKFASQVTKSDILNYFIVKGSKLNITEDMISIDGETVANEVITVTTTDTGNLTIKYDLSSVSSPSMTNLTGDHTYTGFTNKNKWSQISIDSVKFEQIKKNNLPFQVTVQNIVDSLQLSSGYSRDAKDWQWTPLYSDTTSKEYINDQMNGVLRGTIKYLKTSEFPTQIDESIYTLTFDETNSSNFLKVKDLVADPIVFDQQNANTLVSKKTEQEVRDTYPDVIYKSSSTTNSWFDIKQLQYQVNESKSDSAKKTLVLDLQKPQSLNATLNNASLTLTGYWIDAIWEMDVFGPREISLNYDFVNYDWNFDISKDDPTFTVENLMTNSSADIQNEYKDIRYTLPTEFSKNFLDSTTGSYEKFLQDFNLIAVNPSLNPDITYSISDVQLLPNDAEGSMVVSYTIKYNNAGTEIASLNPRLTITGFKSTAPNIFVWLIPLMIVVAVLFIFAIVVLYVRKMKKDKFLHGKNSHLVKVANKYSKDVKRKRK